MDIQTSQFSRKNFIVDAVQVTAENIKDVADWCGGEVRQSSSRREGATRAGSVDYVKVDIRRPMNERQTKAFIGDWVLKAGTGFKVYTQKAFEQNFEEPMRLNGVNLNDPVIAEIDRAARAYGWEIGRGQAMLEVVTPTETNPFLQKDWREYMKLAEIVRSDAELLKRGGSITAQVLRDQGVSI